MEHGDHGLPLRDATLTTAYCLLRLLPAYWYCLLLCKTLGKLR
jgi:hypothetical protein